MRVTEPPRDEVGRMAEMERPFRAHGGRVVLAKSMVDRLAPLKH
jgi:hypothetical protein